MALPERMTEAQDYLVGEGRKVFERLLRRQDAVVEVSSGDSSSDQSEDSSEEHQPSVEEDEEMAMEGCLS